MDAAAVESVLDSGVLGIEGGGVGSGMCEPWGLGSSEASGGASVRRTRSNWFHCSTVINN